MDISRVPGNMLDQYTQCPDGHYRKFYEHKVTHRNDETLGLRYGGIRFQNQKVNGWYHAASMKFYPDRDNDAFNWLRSKGVLRGWDALALSHADVAAIAKDARATDFDRQLWKLTDPPYVARELPAWEISA